MSRFSTVLRIGSSFSKVASLANTFIFQHKNPASLVPALSHKIREELSLESDVAIFTAGAKLFPDLVIPAGKTLRDGIIDALVAVAVKDAAAFCGRDVEVNEPLQGQSQYRTVIERNDDDAEKPVVQGKTAEEMAALLAEQGSDGCAGGGCKI